MRLLIDMQGAQTASRYRGIGRYTLSLVKEMVRLRGENEVILVLNNRFPESIEPLRAAFENQIPPSSIVVMDVIGSVSSIDPANDARRKAAEMAREALFARLNPDMALITTLFEGTEDSVTSIGTFTRRVPTAVILYDLIPLLYSDFYLKDSRNKSLYSKNLDHLRRADLLLSISESSRNEAIDYLGIPAEDVVNISTACDSQFKSKIIGEVEAEALQKKFGLVRPFIMYTGVLEHRKNIERLIAAYASLPKRIRADHQLALVCQAHALATAPVLELIKAKGLDKDEVVMMSYVSEDELLALYNLCKVFVFPSFHEGFGLPALEAMTCGRPVIGSNASSIPEVIGFEDALFDPYDVGSIAHKMEQVLSDEDFRLSLQTYAASQARKFSWEQTATRAWAALTRFASNQKHRPEIAAPAEVSRPRLAYLSPLPPEKSSVSDYTAELLPELARHFDIEIIAAQNEVSNHWISGNYPIRDDAWFLRNASRYDRVLYHFADSHCHEYMFALLSQVPGVVVLHDFFLSNVVAQMDVQGRRPHAWARSLLRAHGWPAVRARYQAENLPVVIDDYPCNLEVIQQALGIIVHSEYSIALARSLYGKPCTDAWTVVPCLRRPVRKPDRQRARERLKLPEDTFVVCSFGYPGATKLDRRLLSAWLDSPLARDANCRLVFVGENNGSHDEEFALLAKTNGLAGSVTVTGWVDENTYQTWLQAADLGVELRALGHGETSGAVIDCMSAGLATIVNANGAMANLPAEAVWMLPDEFSAAELGKALVTLWRDVDLRRSIGTRARDVVHAQHQPRRCADLYAQAIERYYDSAACGRQALVKAVARVEPPLNPVDWRPISAMLAGNFPPRPRQKQLLVDISELVQRDARSGIQRVVRGVLHELLMDPPVGWVVEPVYATNEASPYRYARRFTCRFLGLPDDWAEDEAVEAWAEDIFLGLDLFPHLPQPAKNCLTGWRLRGVKVHFVVYDLLPVLIPESFPEGALKNHSAWLSNVCEFDGVICISRAVSEELQRWHHANGPKRERRLSVNWFHLGADVRGGASGEAASADAAPVLDALRSRVSFLTVATVEPRKGHAQTLAAFEILWAEGTDVNLVFVGKQGWNVEPLIDKIRAHAELGRRLFFLEGVSDGYLENVYSSCSCLIAASVGEGFGLPLIEAAHRKLAIIARDIPVFREVAGGHAFYFSGVHPHDLSAAIKQWLPLYREQKHPKSDAMPWLTWKQSTQQLLEKIACLHDPLLGHGDGEKTI